MDFFRKSLLIITTAFLIQTSCYGDEHRPVANELFTSQADTTSSDFARLDSFMNEVISNKWAAGSTAIIVKNGKVVYDKAFGFKDLEADEAMKTSDIFRIASMSKIIVTAAAMKLVEDGKMKLDDPLYKFIPAFKSPQVLKTFNFKDTTYTTEPAKAEITIRNLMTHTSGIAYGFNDPRMAAIYQKHGIPDLATTKKLTIRETVDKMALLPLGIQPNSRFYYSLSTDVLGRVIEIVSGEPLDKFVAKTILNPIGMVDTYFFLPDNKAKRLVTMYSQPKEGVLTRISDDDPRGNPNFPITGAKTYFSGGSGLSSTTHDYALFLQTILNFGKAPNGKQILKPETVSQMTSNQIGDINFGPGNTFGLGLQIATQDVPGKGIKKGKLSWSGAFNTFYWIDPQRNAVVVLMTQAYPAAAKAKLVSGFEKIANERLDKIK